MKTLQRVAAAGALTIGMLGFAASPALAEPRATQGSDYASYNGTTLTVCDRESDGNGVYAEYLFATGRGKVGDGNGSVPPCGEKRVGDISQFRVCEDTFGSDSCSNWVSA